MTPEEAEALVLREGFANNDTPDDALFMMVRMGDEPSRERMRHLLTALKMTFDAQQGQRIMDRRLAAALWTLGEMASRNLESWECNGRQWSKGFQDDVLDLLTAIESFFYDIWVETHEAHRDSI